MPRRLLGAELKRLRLAAGKSQAEVADVISRARTRIIDLEEGRANLSEDRLLLVLDFLGASPDDREKLLALGAEARKRHPKRSYVDLLPGNFQRNADIESLASRISSYDRGVIPGLLQTPEYAEAQMVTADGVLWESSYQERVNRVAFRLERQKLLSDKELVFVVTDDAFATHVGGPQVMHRQVEHLLSALGKSNISFHLLDSTHPGNPCPYGPMVLLDFDGRTPRAGLLPVLWGPSVYTVDPDDTVVLARCFQRLQEIAFSQEESKARLEALLERI